MAVVVRATYDRSMKLTIEIDEEMAARLHEIAPDLGDDLSAVVREVLRSALGKRSFAMVTYGEGGINPELKSPIRKSSAVLEEVEALDASF
jgi:hypothetical protein